MIGYRGAGVNTEAGYRSVGLMKGYVKETIRPEVLDGLGRLPGVFSMSASKGMEEPILLSGTDGMGTRLKLAFLMDRHDTVRIDCITIYVSSVVRTDGEPLFFLGYIAYGEDIPGKTATATGGVTEGCRQSGSTLIGGETAEVPGFYPEDEYGLAGFSVDTIDKKDLIADGDLRVGGVLTEITSSGVHGNDFSLMRKVFERELTKEDLNAHCDEPGTTLGEALTAPTRICVKVLRNVEETGVTVKACSHITGGGFYENIPRMLRDSVKAIIRKDSYPVFLVFKLLTEKGQVEEQMIYNTHNMGLGMIVAVNPADAEETMKAVRATGETPCVVDSVEKGEKGVSLC